MAPPWVLVILFASGVSLGQAVTCHDKIFGIPETVQPIDYETRTCEGDYCALNGNITGHPTRVYCMNGTAFASFNDRCWSADSYQRKSTCLCSSNFCSDKLQPPSSCQGSLNCGYERNCSSCEVKSYSTTTNKNEYCTSNRFSAIEDILRPNSCVRISNGVEEYVRCVCDSVTCFTGSSGNKTCTGNLCYATRYGSYYYDSNSFYLTYTSHRGCITNNETLFPGLYQVGHIISNNYEFAICSKSSCNSNWTTAMSNSPTITTTVSSSFTSTTTVSTSTIPHTSNSISSSSTSSPTPTTSSEPTAISGYISTTAPSKQAIFESEYLKFFSTVKQSLDQFISKLLEMYR